MYHRVQAESGVFQKSGMLVFWVIVGVVSGISTFADVLQYQARLTDPGTGAPREGMVTMTFSIYDVPTGGAPLWTETKDVEAVNGLVNTLLGDTESLLTGQFDGRDLWLGIMVAPDEEAVPRQRIASTVYAIRAGEAGNADMLDGQDASEFAAVSHTHDATEIGTGALDDARIPDTITRDGEVLSTVLDNDGAGSGLDADWLDGFDSSDFVRSTGPTSITGSAANPILDVTQNGSSFAGRFTSATSYGVVGITASASNSIAGVWGVAGSAGTSIVGKHGVLGESDSGKGVVGVSGSSAGVFGWTSGSSYGVRGETTNSGGVGVSGANFSMTGTACGVKGTSSSSSGVGVLGEVTSSTGTTYGVKGTNTSTTQGAAVLGDGDYVSIWGNGGRWGVYGMADTDGYSVYGANPGGTGYAGYFSGKGFFSSDLSVGGTLTKSAGSFKIDHPLDPENKYLSHSFVESPDMMNVYNGNILLDAQGEAWVELPDWFEALNRDFRYQLTAVGGPGPNLYVAEEIEGNQFKIAGGAPGLKVSWQVTGIRHDPYAEAHRIPVEEDKPQDEKGTYLHPEEYGAGKVVTQDRSTGPVSAE